MAQIGRMCSTALARLIILVTLLVGLIPVTGCQPSTPSSTANQVSSRDALIYGAAVTAVVMLSDLEARHLRTLPSVTADEFAAYERRVERLENAAVILELVRAHLAGEKTVDDVHQSLVDAFGVLKIAIDELEGLKVPVPQKVKDVMKMAGGLL